MFPVYILGSKEDSFSKLCPLCFCFGFCFHKEDNDTPVQSQSEREKNVAGNEGGSVRTTVGVKLPWRQFAADRLATSHSISGCRGQIEMLLSYQPITGLSSA